MNVINFPDEIILDEKFCREKQHELIETIKVAMNVISFGFGAPPRRVVVDKELYETRIRFMEKKLKEMGLVVVVVGELENHR